MLNIINSKIGELQEKFEARIEKSNAGNFSIIYNLKREFRNASQDDVTLELYEKCCKFKKTVINKNFKVSDIFISYAKNEVDVFIEKGVWKK